MALLERPPAHRTASPTSCFLPPGKWCPIEPRGVPECATTSRKPVPATPSWHSSSAALVTIFALVSVVLGILDFSMTAVIVPPPDDVHNGGNRMPKIDLTYSAGA